VAKTNAAPVLDRLGVKYELREYEVDPNDLSAETVATRSAYRQSSSSRPLPCEGTGMESI
jgi:Cys-tRNA(Pro)/Cys-tRNA(Cys) deacylase